MYIYICVLAGTGRFEPCFSRLGRSLRRWPLSVSQSRLASCQHHPWQPAYLSLSLFLFACLSLSLSVSLSLSLSLPLCLPLSRSLSLSLALALACSLTCSLARSALSLSCRLSLWHSLCRWLLKPLCQCTRAFKRRNKERKTHTHKGNYVCM